MTEGVIYPGFEKTAEVNPAAAMAMSHVMSHWAEMRTVYSGSDPKIGTPHDQATISGVLAVYAEKGEVALGSTLTVFTEDQAEQAAFIDLYEQLRRWLIDPLQREHEDFGPFMRDMVALFHRALLEEDSSLQSHAGLVGAYVTMRTVEPPHDLYATLLTPRRILEGWQLLMRKVALERVGDDASDIKRDLIVEFDSEEERALVDFMDDEVLETNMERFRRLEPKTKLNFMSNLMLALPETEALRQKLAKSTYGQPVQIF